MTVKELKLKNFRQFRAKTLSFTKPWTIIVGRNAQGKSTVIEALYVLSHGESPWESNNSHLITTEEDAASSKRSYEKLDSSTSRIDATVETADDLVSLAIILTSNGNSTVKQFEIEGSSTNKQNFSSSFNSVLFSPNLIDTLMYEPSQRRTFLDAYAIQLDPHYQRVINDYRKILRQRNSQLKALISSNGPRDRGRSLQYWTDQLIILGSEILHTRAELADDINTSSENTPAKIIYTPNIDIYNDDELADITSIKELFSNRLEETRKKESYAGITLVGPHRDDWFLSKNGTNLNTYGSRGELRLAIIDVLMRLSDLLAEKKGDVPVLLLDDISSELDRENVKKLFDEKIPASQQAIITTTNINDIPEPIRKRSLVINL